MLIFGHRYFKRELFYHISDIDAIAHTPPNATLFVQWSENALDILEHLRLNSLQFALEVTTLTEALFAENFGAAYIVSSFELAKELQSVAEHYLFDAKILARIESDAQLEEYAKAGIDGVLFAEGVVKS